MGVSLYKHQIDALNRLKSGSVLCGGVGSGKSRVAIAFYYIKICGGSLKINGRGRDLPMRKPKDLYIITTARKRDTYEWEGEMLPFNIGYESNVKIVVDSWNNIGKYSDVTNAFFIFDEQRVVGTGSWSKAFIKIAKSNRWILLSATPGDVWMDYVSVFIANGFYKNKTDFCRKHVIYSRFAKYPKVERYVSTDILEEHRSEILVAMPFTKAAVQHHENIYAKYDAFAMDLVFRQRWDPYNNEPIQEAGKWTLLQRRVVNADPSRVDILFDILKNHPKAIVFYNFDYELDILRTSATKKGIPFTEYNGHKHEHILEERKTWLYLVQYSAGAEGWNCVTTDTIIFFSQNYSYKMMVQASGRIDRLNTPFSDLYYYHIVSNSKIDYAISKALKNKKAFNEKAYLDEYYDNTIV